MDLPRLLVADDHAANRRLLRRMLEHSEYTVDEAKNGQHTLDLLREESYDLVLLDLMMPILSGYDVLTQMKEDPLLAKIPVVVVSALDDLGMVARCIERGAEDYLTKPIDPVILRARVGACLEKKRLRDCEQAYLEAIHKELRLARKIQEDFLPQHLPRFRGWDIGAVFHPAREVAGDFYDVFPLGDSKFCVVMADVCDKGVGAALFMALTRTLVRVFAQERMSISLAEGYDDTCASETSISPQVAYVLETVSRTNSYLLDHHSHANMFVTLFFGVMDSRTGSFAYVNAGHDSPFHIGAGCIQSRLTPTGPGVGILQTEYEMRQIKLNRGDLLVVYTDGLTDARDPEGRFYTEKSLVDLLTETAAGTLPSSSSLLERVGSALKGHVHGAPQSDDVTMLCLLREPVVEPRHEGVRSFSSRDTSPDQVVSK